jgi:hypothetical protein
MSNEKNSEKKNIYLVSNKSVFSWRVSRIFGEKFLKHGIDIFAD